MKRTWSEANAHEAHADEYRQLGIIESLKLRNFMCHENLSFDFDPHMNFIIGRNGSGKSAVLTGIILALGGKSSATGRFGNIKGFIKTGKSSAVVSVTLKNCGPDAYKPDDYGKKITIERHFSLDGVNNYKIKSENGRIISSSKEELTNILNVMDIQVENPCIILNQDTSKTFLVSKHVKGDKLFKLFYEGTGLAKVYDNYNESSQNCHNAKSDLASKKAILCDMEKDMKSIKVLLDRSAKINSLEKELLWATVIEFERERDKKVKDLEKVQSDVSVLTEKFDSCKIELAEVSENIVQLESERKKSDVLLKEIRAKIQEIQVLKANLENETREIEGSCSRYQRTIDKIENMILNNDRIMDTLKKKNQQDLDEEKLKREQTRKNLEQKINDTRTLLREITNNKNNLNDRKDSIYSEIESCQVEIQGLNYEKQRIEKENLQIINGMKNRTNVFGMEMQNVLKKIKDGVSTGIFKTPPVGPIGMYIDVKKPEWAFAIQECLKITFLKSFLCDNNEDAEQLSKIFSQVYTRQRPSIIISKFASEVYDVRAHKCVCQYPTVLDMLNYKNPVVINCLIDQKQIENILLIADPVEARTLMLNHPPNKCKFVYSPNGDQYCHSPVRKYACRNKNQFCILKSLQKDDLKKTEIESERVGEKIDEKIKSKNNLLEKLREVENEIVNLDQKILDMKLQENQLCRKLKDEEMSYVEPKTVDDMSADSENFKKEKAKNELKLTSLQPTLATKNMELKNLQEMSSNISRDCEKESSNYSNLSSQVANYLSKKERLNNYRNKKIKPQLEQLKKELKITEQQVEDQNKVVKAATDSALKACPRIDPEMPLATLRGQLKEMKNTLNQQKHMDRESLMREYEEKVKNFNKAKKDLLALVHLNERLYKMVAVRFEEFSKICKNTSLSLHCVFSTFLNENNFSGYPDISFESKTLNIWARPASSKSNYGEKSNLSQLSGGERSYVTISFLLSLWDRISSPFRILDEYDVFMDSNNRHLSINLIISTANANKRVQYIFLSPLELPRIDGSDHVKVHKMPDPRN